MRSVEVHVCMCTNDLGTKKHAMVIENRFKAVLTTCGNPSLAERKGEQFASKSYKDIIDVIKQNTMLFLVQMQ